MSNFLARMKLVCTAAGMLGISCSQNSIQNTNSRLLTRAPWKYEKAGFDSDHDGIIDALDPKIAECSKDDLTIFKSDGSGSFDAAGIQCDPSDPVSLPFTWSFQNNGKTIYFEEQNFTIKTLSANRLEIYNSQNFGGIKTKYILIFKH